MGADAALKGEELRAILTEIQERVRARHPQGQAGSLGVPLPDLLPVLHARDAAEGKVAAIGSVNPRGPGLANSLIQWVKNQIARGLGWFVRDQVEFNRSLLACIESLMTALNESNQAFMAISARLDEAAALRDEVSELKDIRTHWVTWRGEWERKLFSNEVQFLRSVAELQSAFQHRSALTESNFRDTVRHQHADFVASIDRAVKDVQASMWADLEKIRIEYERLIHTELRLIRQRSLTAPAQPEPAAAPVAAPAAMPFDYARFADRFRGSEEYVRSQQEMYKSYFAGHGNVLDIGCGRGEFLSMLREQSVPAVGIDLDPESVALCHAKGLAAEKADLFVYLAGLPDASLDGVFSSQVIEHLPPERLPEMLKLASAKLRRHGIIAIETPNPECLAIFATHFYLDPTHTRPVPPALLVFYLEEFGFGQIEVKRLAPAAESFPSLASIPPDFRDAFFGGLDYAIIARKL
ncbi:MAG TPA: class I SAM-dependent methyltransferase [Bryobacteraceae bacterium]|nr:class I SAM-dependent methyltransferase [Bryobacteraceae bacterium]